LRVSRGCDLPHTSTRTTYQRTAHPTSPLTANRQLSTVNPKKKDPAMLAHRGVVFSSNERAAYQRPPPPPRPPPRGPRPPPPWRSWASLMRSGRPPISLPFND